MAYMAYVTGRPKNAAFQAHSLPTGAHSPSPCIPENGCMLCMLCYGSVCQHSTLPAPLCAVWGEQPVGDRADSPGGTMAGNTAQSSGRGRCRQTARACVSTAGRSCTRAAACRAIDTSRRNVWQV